MSESGNLNQTEIKYLSHEFYLQYAGSLWITDSISLFIIPFMVIIGIVLNVIGFLIMRNNPEFNYKLYVYLKVMFLNSALTNCFGVLFAFVNARRYLSFSNSWFAMVYSLQVVTPCVYVTYFYNNMLDLYLAFDKLSIFNGYLSNINKKVFKRPYLVCFVTAIYCILVDLPIFFTFSPTAEEVNLSENETYLFYDYKLSDFGVSNIGVIYTAIDFFLMDVLPFLFLVLLNIPLAIYLRRYYKSKSKIVKTRKNLRKVESKEKRSKEVNAGLMVLLICLVSFIKNSLIIIAIVYTYIEIGLVSVLLYNYAYYFVFLASTLNFIIIYYFDKKFKSIFNKNFFYIIKNIS